MSSTVNRKGWIPIRLKFAGGEAFVDWCWLGSERFTEPFFDQTVSIAQNKPFNALFTHRTPIAELGEWHAGNPGMEPSGFVFHMSRCGSTLVSQMFAALPDAVVISEASPIDWLARASRIPEATRAEWLRWMVSALGQRRSGRETRYFIKFDSTTILALPSIRRAFPQVPWVFIYREPEEVLLSHMRDPAPAMAPGFVTDMAVIEAPVSEAAVMPAEEYAARVIGKLCDCAAAGLDERGLLVNYTQLPEAGWGGIARRFGAVLLTDDLRLMREATTRHAKWPERQFKADSAGKRGEVSMEMRRAVAAWMSLPYAELERLRKGRTSPT